MVAGPERRMEQRPGHKNTQGGSRLEALAGGQTLTRIPKEQTEAYLFCGVNVPARILLSFPL